MHPNPLTKLRLSFLALGALLFVPLLWLIHSVNARVEAQRRLRHQVVAERIFDELERELTRVLREESSRPSSAFDRAGPDSAPPYVVGYFRTENEAPTALRVQGPDGKARVDRALVAANLVTTLPSSLQGAKEPPPKSQRIPAPATPSPASRSMSPAEVLRKLNRASEDRQEAPTR
ncbi:MAG TPA: hypothetical protein VFQ35_10680 [Polyangiaceae bacterium]|nr:hypothetical protein [Polyangiaceae bacterium]